jgi:hypothetical protein
LVLGGLREWFKDKEKAMHKYFVVLLSVVLFVICGCDKAVSPPAFQAVSEDGVAYSDIEIFMDTSNGCDGLIFDAPPNMPCKAFDADGNGFPVFNYLRGSASVSAHGACSVVCDLPDF